MKITDQVYLLDSSSFSHAYIILDQENTLIDTGMNFDGKGIKKDLEALGIAPQSITNIYLSHHDVDHTGNAGMLQEWTGAAVWAPEEDIPYISGKIRRSSLKGVADILLRVKKPKNVQAFVPGTTLNGIQVIKMPGHTPGYVCFLYRGVLFAGDLLENQKRGYPPVTKPWDWDRQKLSESAKAICAYPFDWICPAHGKPVRRSESVFKYE